MSRIASIFDAFRSIRVGVIGDVMLDTYCWGHVERISPEAPVPVVEVRRREHRLGGAGNVALNLSRLGAHVSVLSVVGADAEGEILRGLFRELSIDDSHLLSCEDRVTTQKTRIIARNQQMMRLDSEMSTDLSAEWEDRLFDAVTAYLEEESPQLLIFEDYDKGVLTEGLIRRVLSVCRSRGILTAVDPKKRHFLSYVGVDIFKPNLKEVREGLGIRVEPGDTASLDAAHAALFEKLRHRISLITLSEHGIYHAEGGRSHRIPTHQRSIADVSGAGDTVIAVAGLVFAVTGDMALAAEMANIAGGVVCEEVGTVAISRERLEAECRRLMSDADGKDAASRP
jgi:rfaE bifunctional protein kinase chain/domain